MIHRALPIGLLDWILWTLQILLLALAWRHRRKSCAEDSCRSLTWQSCLISLLLAWTWRLIYCFVLASSGFWYLVPDDAARWRLSRNWAMSPYVITWDGIWQGGTFYLHGAAMALLHDPLVASKFVAAFCNLLPLIGIFALAQGLYGNRRLSCVAVVAAAPWWFHILLGTGTMTEMPVTGLMLTGLGLLFLALDPTTGDRGAGAAVIGASFCFMAATAFHIIAWMMLAPFLLAFAPRLLSTPKAAIRRRLPLFAVISLSYCVVWFAGCWIKFGHPLAFLSAYDANNTTRGILMPLSMRATAYPLAFLYDAWLILPALAAGAIGACLGRDEKAGKERVILGGAGGTLAILIASAVVGSPGNFLPMRSVVTIVAALFPMSLAAIAAVWPARGTGRSSAGKLSIAAVMLLGIAWVTVNHRRTFQRVRSQQSLDPDAVATGVWLRESCAHPDEWGRGPSERVIHLWVGAPWYPDLTIEYLFGSPRRVVEHGPGEEVTEVLSSVHPDEWLVTDRALNREGWEKIVTIGRYQIFRAKGASR